MIVDPSAILSAGVPSYGAFSHMSDLENWKPLPLAAEHLAGGLLAVVLAAEALEVDRVVGCPAVFEWGDVVDVGGFVVAAGPSAPGVLLEHGLPRCLPSGVVVGLLALRVVPGALCGAVAVVAAGSGRRDAAVEAGSWSSQRHGHLGGQRRSRAPAAVTMTRNALRLATMVSG
jgi:hypothetical protein